MPIYRQRNSETTVEATLPVEYWDAEQRYAKDSVVVHFGTGDILVCCGSSRNAFSDEILLQHIKDARPIGEQGSMVGEQLLPPVRLIFDAPASIDVFIRELERLKTDWPSEKPKDGGERQHAR